MGMFCERTKNVLVKKCMGYAVEGVRLRARLMKTLSEIVEEDHQAQHNNYARKMLWTAGNGES